MLGIPVHPTNTDCCDPAAPVDVVVDVALRYVSWTTTFWAGYGENVRISGMDYVKAEKLESVGGKPHTVFTLTRRETRELGRLTRQLRRWTRDSSATVDWALLREAMLNRN